MLTQVATSSYRVGPSQSDGRCVITETHLLTDGRTIDFEYLAALGSVDPDAVMVSRAAQVNANLAVEEATISASAAAEVPLTKFQFRQLRTLQERIACDKFEAFFESNEGLQESQKDLIRTYLRDYEESSVIYLSSEATVAVVLLWEDLGLIAKGRASEILNG